METPLYSGEDTGKFTFGCFEQFLRNLPEADIIYRELGQIFSYLIAHLDSGITLKYVRQGGGFFVGNARVTLFGGKEENEKQRKTLLTKISKFTPNFN
jgi:hypothetical protein